jgi:hypothetical protein
MGRDALTRLPMNHAAQCSKRKSTPEIQTLCAATRGRHNVGERMAKEGKAWRYRNRLNRIKACTLKPERGCHPKVTTP